MGYALPTQNATPLYFLLVLASDHLTGATGKTPTVTIRKPGGSFASPAGAVTEVANGIYMVAGNATDANTPGTLLLHAIATGCDPRDDSFEVLPESASVLSVSVTEPHQIARGNTTRPLTFLLVLSSDHITGATGKTPTVTILKSGGSFAAPAGAVTELGNGLYEVAANATDANTNGPLFLHATASACDPRDDAFEVLEVSAVTSALTSGVSASRIIDGALRLIGVLQGGETAEADDANDALMRLNELIDSWLTQGLTALSVGRTAYSLTTSGSYTIGSGATLNQVWPATIERAELAVTLSGTAYQWPLTKLTADQYADISVKSQTSPYPTAFYYDHAFSNGLGTIQLWPVPDGTTSLQLILSAPATIRQYATLATTYALPPAYAKALRYNLAVDLWSEYPENPLPGFVVQQAQRTLWDLKRLHVRVPELVSCWGIGGHYNVFTDQVH